MANENITQLKVLSKRLLETEAELSAFFYLSPVLLCISGSNGIFKKVNPQWTKLLGWTAEELTTHPWLFFVHPEDVPISIAAAEHLKTDNLYRFKNRYRAKNGEYKTIQWNASVYFEGQTFCVAEDVTNIK